MTTDLWMLVATGLWSACVPGIYAYGRLSRSGGNAWSFGNRDQPLAVPPWVDRAVRAHANLTENLTLFAILVLVTHVTGKANAVTATGAVMFFGARVAHTLIYTAGWIYLRTAAFFIGMLGEIMILLQLLK
jgi:uncharacterized MAPEG superfamily protein